MDVMRELLHHGIDVNSSDVRDTTALHKAALFNNAGVVHVLVEAGADIETRDEAMDKTPLHSAAVAGSCGALLALLQHKAEVDAQDITTGDPRCIWPTVACITKRLTSC